MHSPYLREAKVKDISIQLLHCPREPVSAEILSTELAVETPHTHIDKAKCCENRPTGDISILCPGFLANPGVNVLAASTCLNCTASFRVLRRFIFSLLAFHQQALLALVSPVSTGQVMKPKDPLQPSYFGSPFKSCIISCSQPSPSVKTEHPNNSIKKPAETLHNFHAPTSATTILNT